MGDGQLHHKQIWACLTPEDSCVQQGIHHHLVQDPVDLRLPDVENTSGGTSFLSALTFGPRSLHGVVVVAVFPATGGE